MVVRSLIFVLCMLATRARADTLVLYEQPALRPGLCTALRIQLTGLADVTCRTDLAGEPAQRIDAASRALQGAERLAVLLESDERYARMLIVGDAPDRALLAIEPVEARPEPDVDRALALKVRETFELARSTPVVTTRRAQPGWLEVGAGLSAGMQARALGVAALGLRREHARGFVELGILGRLASELEHARIREREWALAATARLGFVHARLSYGPSLELAIVRAYASSDSADGRQGESARALPRFVLALDLRLVLTRSLALRFAPGLELDPLARRFRSDDDVLSLGHVRASLSLSLVIGLGT
ncbi:MAG: hypothetical protein ABW352_11355 [Polyangiales bacterium]